MNSLTTYISDAVQELHHVRWPTRQQAVRLSAIVVVFCLVSSAAFGLVDFGLSEAVKFLLQLTY